MEVAKLIQQQQRVLIKNSGIPIKLLFDGLIIFSLHRLQWDRFLCHSPVIKEHMRYIIDHLDEIDKLIKIKVQVSEVKNVMLENINKVLDSLLYISIAFLHGFMTFIES